MKITFSMILEKTAQLLHCEPDQVIRKGTRLDKAAFFAPEVDEHSACTLEEGPITRVAAYRRGTMDGDATTLYIASAGQDVRGMHAFCIADGERMQGEKPVALGDACDTTPDAACEVAKNGVCGAQHFVGSIAVAVFPPRVSRSQLQRAASEALAFFTRWSHRVLDMVYRGEGLDAIVPIAYEALQNPLLIYDSSLKVLAYTRNDGSSDRLWTETVERGAISTMLDEAQTEELMLYIDKLDRNKRPFFHRSRDLTEPFYSCNIMLHTRRAGMITLMERNHAVTQGDLGLLELFAYLLSFELQKDVIRRENTGLIYNQLLLDLINGNIDSPQMLHSRMAATRWQVDTYLRAIHFEPDGVIISQTEWKYIFDQLLILNLNGKGILLKESIVFLCSSPSDQLGEGDALPRALFQFCTRHKLRCGVSDAYTDILRTHRMLGQSRRALELSQATVTCFAQVRFLNLLAYCRSHPSREEILHPAALILARHDAEHQTEYIATLKALFDCQYNQSLAAQRLHIHRTTMFYRMQKIVELTGLHLDDAQETLLLHLSLLCSREQDISAI